MVLFYNESWTTCQNFRLGLRFGGIRDLKQNIWSHGDYTFTDYFTVKNSFGNLVALQFICAFDVRIGAYYSNI